MEEYRARMFDDEVTATAGDESTAGPAMEATTDPDYAFDGYSVEFVDKVALLAVPAASPRAR